MIYIYIYIYISCMYIHYIYIYIPLHYSYDLFSYLYRIYFVTLCIHVASNCSWELKTYLSNRILREQQVCAKKIAQKRGLCSNAWARASIKLEPRTYTPCTQTWTILEPIMLELEPWANLSHNIHIIICMIYVCITWAIYRLCASYAWAWAMGKLEPWCTYL